VGKKTRGLKAERGKKCSLDKKKWDSLAGVGLLKNLDSDLEKSGVVGPPNTRGAKGKIRRDDPDAALVGSAFSHNLAVP